MSRHVQSERPAPPRAKSRQPRVPQRRPSRPARGRRRPRRLHDDQGAAVLRAHDDTHDAALIRSKDPGPRRRPRSNLPARGRTRWQLAQRGRSRSRGNPDALPVTRVPRRCALRAMMVSTHQARVHSFSRFKDYHVLKHSRGPAGRGFPRERGTQSWDFPMSLEPPSPSPPAVLRIFLFSSTGHEG